MYSRTSEQRFDKQTRAHYTMKLRPSANTSRVKQLLQPCSRVVKTEKSSGRQKRQDSFSEREPPQWRSYITVDDTTTSPLSRDLGKIQMVSVQPAGNPPGGWISSDSVRNGYNLDLHERTIQEVLGVRDELLLDGQERYASPSSIYLMSWYAYVPEIIDYYMTDMHIDMPNNCCSETARSLRAQFLSLIITDRASFYATMLLAAACYMRVRDQKAQITDLPQLRDMALREIRSALTEECRGTSDSLVAAVAIMASYEALFGDHLICETHMQGLMAMVKSRGGLLALGLDGLLKRHVIWTDWHNSTITNKRPNFGYGSTIATSGGVFTGLAQSG